MYELLLEKESQLFFRLFQQLSIRNGQSILELGEELEASAYQLLLSIHRWQVKGHHLQVGMDVVKEAGQLYVLKSERFCEQELFANLLSNSIPMELLKVLWVNPSYGIGELAEATFHSPQTVRRRLRGLLPLLLYYDLQLDIQKRPMLCGSEAQLRFFYLHLELLLAGSRAEHEPKPLLAKVLRLAEERASQHFLVKRAWFDRQLVHDTLGLAEYVINERGYRFLWKQLLGLEPVWIRGKLEQALNRYFEYEANLAGNRRELSADLYRLHLMAWLFKGDLTLALSKPDPVVEVSAKRLERVLQEYLPQYEQLLALHSELPACYVRLIQKYRDQSAPIMRLYGL